MTRRPSRRQFVAGTAAGTIASTFIPGLPSVSADEIRATTRIVQFGSGIESLVRLIEDSSRERLLEKIAAQINIYRYYIR